MTEDRLWQRTQDRIEEGRDRRLLYKAMLREFVGEGGIRLNKQEKLQLFQTARLSLDLRMAILQAEQERFKMKPDQWPKTLIHDLQQMQAMED